MVPNGWEQKKLGKIAELQRGFDLPTRKRMEGTVPIISSGGHSGFHNEAKVKAPGIVTGRYGSIGDVFYIQEDFWPLNTSLWVKDFHGNDVKYIYYLLSKIDYAKFSDKTGVPGVNRNDLHAIKTLVPPLPEQKKIACILSTWDKAIETVDKLIENSQQQKMALMQQLLTGKKRLPGFSGEWKEAKLRTLCDVRRGASPRPIKDKKWFAEEGRGWIRIADATASESRYLVKTTQKLSTLGVEKSVKVDPGDLIMSICGTIGIPRILATKACIHDGFVVFRNYEEQLHLEFLYHYLNLFTSRLANSGQPGTQKNLNTTIVGTLDVPSLTLEEQEAISVVLNQAEEHTLTLKREAQALRTQKQALMQQLLTGKRRVQIDDMTQASA